MEEIELRKSPSIYRIKDSSRGLNDVLVGEDPARSLIEVSSSGNDVALQSLLAQPHWAKLVPMETHCIYYQSSPTPGPDGLKEVYAMPMRHLDWALFAAATQDRADVTSTLLTFAKDHGIKNSNIITRPLVTQALKQDSADVFKVLATVDPEAIYCNIHHGYMPLYEAVRLGRIRVVCVLLELGADHKRVKSDGSYAEFQHGLLSRAAVRKNTLMTRVLLDHGVPTDGSGALHTAASSGHVDQLRLLLDRGANIDEIEQDWTAMHYAAKWGKMDAMKFLESQGAEMVKDGKGKTPADLLEEYQAKRTS
ncbi:Hypothetical protein D9617_5g069870 [Elsinoe fawcettii]|nr:Hypothetical protein D9617_5g069870 [Elsinoe fawcettii]